MMHWFGQAGTFSTSHKLLHGIYESHVLSSLEKHMASMRVMSCRLKSNPPSHSEWWVAGRKRPVESTDSILCYCTQCLPPNADNYCSGGMLRATVSDQLESLYMSRRAVFVESYKYSAVTTTGVVAALVRASSHREVRTNP
jgi:hypothetical protein